MIIRTHVIERDADTRIFLLCNPHNPTGRAFEQAELEALAEIALEHDLIVVSDEIHSDLVFPGHRHVPFATLGPEIAERTTSQIFTIEVSVTDNNNQQVSNRTDVIVHRGLFYIGLKPERYVNQAGKGAEVEIITVDWESEPVPKRDLTVIFYQHKWYSVWEEGEDGRFYWKSTVEDTPVLTTTVTTDQEGKAVAAFTPEKGGVYKIAASGEDEQGHEVRSSTYLWVSGYKFINWRRCRPAP